MRRSIAGMAVALMSVVGAVALPSEALAAGPSNDLPANAIALTSAATSEITGSNARATDIGDPDGGGREKVWFSWQAPASGTFRVDTFGSNFDTVLAVWSADAATKLVESDDAASTFQSATSFSGVAGTTYLLSVGGYYNPSYLTTKFGYIRLFVSFGDNGLSTGSSSITGITPVALPSQAQSVCTFTHFDTPYRWFAFIPSGSGNATIDTFGSGVDTVLAVVSSQSNAAPTCAAVNDDSFGGTSSLESSVNFPLVLGRRYFVILGMYAANQTAPLRLNWTNLSTGGFAVEPSPPSPPNLPADFAVDPSGELVWAAVSAAPPVDYRVYRGPTGGAIVPIGSTASTSFSDAPGPGDWTYWVTTRNDYGESTPATLRRIVPVDPDTAIDAGPSGVQTSRDASLEFSATLSGSALPTASFTCSLDAGAAAACTSPQSYSALGAGNHLFSVRAKNPDTGAEDASPASRSWAVEPVTSLDSGPAPLHGASTATFTFSSTDSGATFRCTLDGAAPQTCTSPAGYSALANGSHTFTVAAAVDNVADSTPAQSAFAVDTTEPETSITSGPATTTASTVPSFAFTSTMAGATFACSMDGAAATACTSPSSYSGLSDGSHTFAVRATSPAGIADPSPASRAFLKDTKAPLATVTAPTVAGTIATSVAATWKASDTGTGTASYDVRWQSAPYTGGFGAWQYPSTWQRTTATSRTLSSLAVGRTYCFQARARDKVGNLSGWSTSRCVARALDDRSLSVVSGWTRGTGSSYYLGTITSSTTSGSRLTRSGTQFSKIGVVATVCPTCGSIGIYLNGTLIGTRSLYAAATSSRKVIMLSGSKYRTGTVTIKVLSSGKAVRIDGLVLARL